MRDPGNEVGAVRDAKSAVATYDFVIKNTKNGFHSTICHAVLRSL